MPSEEERIDLDRTDRVANDDEVHDDAATVVGGLPEELEQIARGLRAAAAASASPVPSEPAQGTPGPESVTHPTASQVTPIQPVAGLGPTTAPLGFSPIPVPGIAQRTPLAAPPERAQLSANAGRRLSRAYALPENRQGVRWAIGFLVFVASLLVSLGFLGYRLLLHR